MYCIMQLTSTIEGNSIRNEIADVISLGKFYFRAKQMALKIKVFFVSLVVIWGCEQSEVIQSSESQIWQRDLRFTGVNAILTNSKTLQDRLVVTSLNNWNEIDTNGRLVDYPLPFDLNIDQKIPVTQTLFAHFPGRTGHQIEAITVDNVSEDLFTGFYDLMKIDSNATGFADFFPRKIEYPTISESSHILVPYRTNRSEEFSLLIIKPQVLQRGARRVINPDETTSTIKKVNIPGYTNPTIWRIDTYQDFFFLSTFQSFYRIDSLGNYDELLSERITGLIKKSDSLIALTSENKTYLTRDKGSTWEQFFDFPTEDSYEFVNLNNHIIGYPRLETVTESTPLRIVSIDENSFRIENLPIEGLEFSDITSLSLFSGKIYATTLSGLYYSELDVLIPRN